MANSSQKQLEDYEKAMERRAEHLIAIGFVKYDGPSEEEVETAMQKGGFCSWLMQRKYHRAAQRFAEGLREDSIYNALFLDRMDIVGMVTVEGLRGMLPQLDSV